MVPSSPSKRTWVSHGLGLGVGSRMKRWIEIVVPGWFPNVGMLGSLFSVRFYTDFIGSLESLGWSIRGRSEFCPLGLSRGLFSIFEVRNWQFSWFRRFWFVIFGGRLWGYGIGSGPFFIEGH